MTTMTTRAREWRYVRLRPDTKSPCDPGWQLKPLSESETDPSARAVHCGASRLIVVDEDTPGARSNWLNGRVLPDTFSVRTASGKLHWYYSLRDDVPGGDLHTRTDVDGFDLDLLAGNHVAVAPGSIVGGRRYLIDCDRLIATAPDWLIDAVTGKPAESVPVVSGEPLPEPLPDTVVDALNNSSGNRSDDMYWLISRAFYANLSHGQAVTLASMYAPAVDKYGDRLDAEVARCWGKLETNDRNQANADEALLISVGGSVAALPVQTNGHEIPAPEPNTNVRFDDFWHARPELQRIHDFALSRRASPWATLGVVFVRVMACVPHTVVLPPIVGGKASLNMFVGLVGPSGSGKGAAMSTAVDAVTLGPTATWDVHTLGSGQGIAHAYARWEKDEHGSKRITRYAYSAVFSVEEVDHLVGLTGQSGSTLLPELRRMYMGEKLGHLYVDPTRRMPIEAHTYRAGLVLGIQPARAAVLLDDADGGTPQRILWMPAIHPHPDIRPTEPTPWRWTAPGWPKDSPPGPTVGPALPHAPQATLRVCQTAWTTIDAAALARQRGQDDPLDGHALLCQEKVAAALGILGGRAEVAEQDWELAGVVMDMSNATRQTIISTLVHQGHHQNVMKAEAAANRELIVEGRREQTAVARVCRWTVKTLRTTGGQLSRSELRRKCASRDRDFLESALDNLISAGQIVSGDTAKGVQYRMAEGAA